MAKSEKFKTGDKAPDFTLMDSEGSTVFLSEIMRNKRGTLLVFLRHLG
jgi:peroxiredoxin